MKSTILPLGDLVGWAAASVIYAGCCLAKGAGLDMEQLAAALVFLPVVGLMSAVMLPLQLKYGAEKSRLALAVLFGGIGVLGALGMKLFPGLPNTLRAFPEISGAALGAAALGAVVAAVALSYWISLGIMEKKEL